MTKIIDKENPYRLEAKIKDIGVPWRYVMEFGADKLESNWAIVKLINGMNKSLLLQIVPNLVKYSCAYAKDKEEHLEERFAACM